MAGVTSRPLGTMVQRKIAIGTAAHAEIKAPPPVAWAPTVSLQSGRYDIPAGCLSVPSLDRRLVDLGALAKGQQRPARFLNIGETRGRRTDAI